MFKSYDAVIIGAGFSGTMVAVHLARTRPSHFRIALIERRSAGPALGVAYSTTDPKHVLNVRAGQMGAFPENIADFADWLRRKKVRDAGEDQGQDLTPLAFVSRKTYGIYLQELLQKTKTEHPNLQCFQDDIVRIVKDPEMRMEPRSDALAQSRFLIEAASETLFRSRHVVLALGNFPPGEKTPDVKDDNPYAPSVWQELSEPGDILIIGTGLTSLDMLLTLAETKKDGVIHLLSRRGLFPNLHIPTTSYRSYLSASDLPETAVALLQAVRSEVRKAQKTGTPWQSVIDALRPLNQKIWEKLPLNQKKIFLHRLRPFWETHRHRCAPEVLAVRNRLMDQGRLRLHKGYILAQEAEGSLTRVTWRPKGSDVRESFLVRRIVNCTGPQADVRKISDVLVQNLLAEKLIRPDPLKQGFDTDDCYAVLGADGQAVKGLWALGSALKGRLYESVAVPELRVQASDVAAGIF